MLHFLLSLLVLVFIPPPAMSSGGTGANNGGGADDDSGGYKKGPWSPQEDAILVDYINKHGPGNWNAVQKNSGLNRCGKSCRLRWTNHLRPDLKKGSFTPDEEEKIIELHNLHGNKWARIAKHVGISFSFLSLLPSHIKH